MSRTATSHLLLSIISLLTPAVVKAEQATWIFEGVVTDSFAPDAIPNGSLLSGQYTFEFGFGEYPHYVGSVNEIHGGLGAFDFHGLLLSTSETEIANGQGGADWYRMASLIEFGGQLGYFRIGLFDSDGTIFDSAKLTASPPSLSELDYAFFAIHAPGGGTGHITKLTYVPEPITSVLLLAGASWFCGRWKTGKRDHE